MLCLCLRQDGVQTPASYLNGETFIEIIAGKYATPQQRVQLVQ